MKATYAPAQSNRIARGNRQAHSLTPGQRFQHLKTSLRRRYATDMAEIPMPLIRRALEEAEEVAAATGFPHLFFPELAAEQVRRIATALRPEPHFQVRALTDAYAA
jgi:hypothetical protein